MLFDSLYQTKGDFEAALFWLERALAVATEWNLMFLVLDITQALGCVHAFRGDFDKGLSLLETARAGIESTRPRKVDAVIYAHLGEVQMLAGQLGDAIFHVEAARKIAVDCGQRAIEAHTLRMLGDLARLSSRPDPEKAQSWYEQAIKIAEVLGMRPLLARCYLGLGGLRGSEDQEQTALAYTREAIAMFREMGMQYWLERAESTLTVL